VHEGHQGKAPWGLSRLATTGKQILNIFLFVQRSSRISHLHPHVALRQDGMRDAGGLFWKSWDRLWMHRQGFPPGFINALVPVPYLIYLSDPTLIIRQQYLNGTVPQFGKPLLDINNYSLYLFYQSIAIPRSTVEKRMIYFSALPCEKSRITAIIIIK